MGSPDAPSRRLAASAIGLIAVSGVQEKMESITTNVCQNLRTIQSRQVETRHGLLLSLAMIIKEVGAHSRGPQCVLPPLKLDMTEPWSILRSICSLPYDDPKYFGSRSDLTAEAACTLISALSMPTCSVKPFPGHWGHFNSPEDLDSCIAILNRGLLLSGENIVKVSSSTADQLFDILDANQRESLIQSWASPLKRVTAHSGSNSVSAVGYLAALGAVAHHVSTTVGIHTILDTLLYQINASALMEVRVAALKSLSTVLESCQSRGLRFWFEPETDLSSHDKFHYWCPANLSRRLHQ